jgi:hypothetical protein
MFELLGIGAFGEASLDLIPLASTAANATSDSANRRAVYLSARAAGTLIQGGSTSTLTLALGVRL